MNWNTHFEQAKEQGKFSLDAKHDVKHWTLCMIGHRDNKLNGLLRLSYRSIRLLSPHVIELGKRVKDLVISDNVIEDKKIYDEINSIGKKEFYRFVPLVKKIQKRNKTIIVYTCPVCKFEFKKINKKCPNCNEILEWCDIK